MGAFIDTDSLVVLSSSRKDVTQKDEQCYNFQGYNLIFHKNLISQDQDWLKITNFTQNLNKFKQTFNF